MASDERTPRGCFCLCVRVDANDIYGDKMKRSNIAGLAVTACVGQCCIAMPAMAQAQAQSVEIYGRFQVAAIHQRFGSTPTTGSANLWALASDSSYIGFRGSEDLGGGTRAYFKIEHGFQADTGAQTSGTFWSRETYVALRNNSLGAIQIGSQYTPAIFVSLRTDPFTRVHLGAAQTLLQGSRAYTVSFGNTIEYITPDWGGFRGRLQYVLHEGALGAKAMAATAEYTGKGFYIAGSHESRKVTGASVGQAGTPEVDSHTSFITGYYDVASVRLRAWLQKNRTDNLPDVNSYMVGATMPAGNGDLRATYVNRRTTGSKATLIAAGYSYNFSKRTALYGTVGRMSNDGTANFTMFPARNEAAGAGLVGAGRSSTGLELGIRHLF